MKVEIKNKETGLDWCPLIPEHWEVKKIRWGFKIIGSGTTPKAGDSEYYEDGIYPWLQTGDLTDGDITNTSKRITEQALIDYSTLRFYDIDSLVIAMYGATIGKVGILKLRTTTNQACCVLSNPDLFYTKFVFYWFIANRKNIISLSYGGGQPNISQELIRSIKLQCPPISEQQKIANYLDQKTTQIDTIIARKEKLIELLKEERTAIINQAVTKGLNPDVEMKPLGIDWLGDIPKHWRVSKAKYISSRIGDGIHTTPEFVDTSEYYFINGTNLKNGEIVIFNNTRCVDKDELEKLELHLQDGTILISLNGTIGNLAIYRNEEVILGKSAAYIECLNISNLLLYYYLQTNYVAKYFEQSLNGTTIGNLSLFTLRNTVICFPPNEIEQLAIVDFLNKEIKRVDTIITKTKKQIELLKEYKTALINDVVTGQKII